jgi:hypothetical protein
VAVGQCPVDRSSQAGSIPGSSPTSDQKFFCLIKAVAKRVIPRARARRRARARCVRLVRRKGNPLRNDLSDRSRKEHGVHSLKKHPRSGLEGLMARHLRSRAQARKDSLAYFATGTSWRSQIPADSSALRSCRFAHCCDRCSTGIRRYSNVAKVAATILGSHSGASRRRDLGCGRKTPLSGLYHSAVGNGCLDLQKDTSVLVPANVMPGRVQYRLQQQDRKGLKQVCCCWPCEIAWHTPRQTLENRMRLLWQIAERLRGLTPEQLLHRRKR